jgi:hypothetical protein
MNDKHGHRDLAGPLPNILPACPNPEKIVVSPLGWSIKGRLLCAAGASALLWLSVAWAIGWLS